MLIFLYGIIQIIQITDVGGPPNFFLTMLGDGEVMHLGEMTTTITFCVNTSNGYYYDTVGSFVFANGDELFFEIPEGQIYPNQGDNSDYYQTQFNDLLIFTGEQVRFEDASGDAMTNAFVHDGQDEWRTDFFTEGFIVLKKSRQ